MLTVFCMAVELYQLTLRSEAAAEVAVNCDRHFHHTNIHVDYFAVVVHAKFNSHL